MLRRPLWDALLRVGAVLILPLLWLMLPEGAWAQGSDTPRAGVVAVYGDGRVVTRCVSFSDETLSGLDLLQQAGLGPLFSSGPMGSLLCSLSGEGCPTSDCLCECKASPCTYWNYFHRNPDGSWAYAGIGAAARLLRDGEVDGWVWGDGSSAPPVLPFEDICPLGVEPAAVPTVTATTAPPSTSTPSPTAAPTLTAVPTETAAPAPSTIQPTPTPTPLPTQTLQPTSHPTPLPASATPAPLPGPAEPVAESRGVDWAGYGAFALLVLGVGILFWRQRKS